MELNNAQVMKLFWGQCPLSAKAWVYKSLHNRKRVLGVAKRPREISNAQARHQNPCFFWKKDQIQDIGLSDNPGQNILEQTTKIAILLQFCLVGIYSFKKCKIIVFVPNILSRIVRIDEKIKFCENGLFC